MASRVFRSEHSLEGELATRGRIENLLERHGVVVTGREWVQTGLAIVQVIEGHLGDGPPMRIHVRLCWRRDGRNASETLYSAAQLRAKLKDGDWHKTLESVAERHARARHTHSLLVQNSAHGFVFAALVPCSQIPKIWERQHAVSMDLIERGLAGRITRSHARNGSSPTLWLQDDRYEATGAVARVLWEWPGVVNVMAMPRRDQRADDHDTLDDIVLETLEPGRDGAQRIFTQRSGYPRDPAVREAVRKRASGACEREGCGARRDYPGFLDVHHILGIEVSDRVWTCVALCPNCHREAHIAPDAATINAALASFAAKFR